MGIFLGFSIWGIKLCLVRSNTQFTLDVHVQERTKLLLQERIKLGCGGQHIHVFKSIQGGIRMNVQELESFERYGFMEVYVEEGMTNAEGYTAKCSGARSDCCTRVCRPNNDFAVESSGEWELFLQVKGGQVQY